MSEGNIRRTSEGNIHRTREGNSAGRGRHYGVSAGFRTNTSHDRLVGKAIRPDAPASYRWGSGAWARSTWRCWWWSSCSFLCRPRSSAGVHRGTVASHDEDPVVCNTPTQGTPNIPLNGRKEHEHPLNGHGSKGLAFIRVGTKVFFGCHGLGDHVGCGSSRFREAFVVEWYFVVE
jgi:hypothetical protein